MAENIPKGGRGGNTSWRQYLSMVEWLEVPENFTLITSSHKSNKPVVAGQPLTKVAAYSALADHVNQQCGSNWSRDQGKTRYHSYLEKYKKLLLNTEMMVEVNFVYL
jgi:hypothetical protein